VSFLRCVSLFQQGDINIILSPYKIKIIQKKFSKSKTTQKNLLFVSLARYPLVPFTRNLVTTSRFAHISKLPLLIKTTILNKEERHSRVPGLSDTR